MCDGELYKGTVRVSFGEVHSTMCYDTSTMSLRIYVDGYSGGKANERPTRFHLDDETHEIALIEDRWQGRNESKSISGYEPRRARCTCYGTTNTPTSGRYKVDSTQTNS